MTPLRAPVSAPLLLAAALGLGCLVWEPFSRDQSLRDPRQVAEETAVHLRPGDAHAGELDCKGGRCDQWLRVRVDQVGVLRVEARIEGLAEKAVARLFLQNSSGKTLAHAVSSDGLPLRVESAVEPGPFAVLLQTGGGPVSYAVETALEAATTPSLQPGSSDPDLHHDGKLALEFPPGSCLTKTETQEYFQQVKRAIVREWSTPTLSAPEQAVSLRLRIAASGELLEAEAAPDVDARLAASALAAVHRAAPFARMRSGAECLRGSSPGTSP